MSFDFVKVKHNMMLEKSHCMQIANEFLVCLVQTMLTQYE